MNILMWMRIGKRFRGTLRAAADAPTHTEA